MLRNASGRWLVAGAALALLATGGTAQAQLFGSRRPCNTCPPSPVPMLTPTTMAPAAVPGSPPGASPAAPTPATPNANDPSLAAAALAGTGGVAADRDGGGGDRPFFQGDFIPANGCFITGHGRQDVANSLPASPGNAVGRYKASEMNSPIPTDRVFLSLGYFNSAASANGLDTQTVTPGVEKTFLGGWVSADLRLPFASTLANAQSVDQFGVLSDARGTILGNVSMAGKLLIFRDDQWAVGGGVGFQIPTAGSTSTDVGGVAVRLVNQCLHIQPFVGALWTPNDRFWSQGLLQVDLIATGNPVEVGGARVGMLTDVNLFHFDWQAGYKLFRSQDSNAVLRFLAPYGELHYNQAFGTGDQVGLMGSALLTTGAGSMANLNLVGGLMAGIGSRGQVLLGATVPVAPTGAGKPFDWEVGLRLGYFFGPSGGRVPTF